MQLIQLVTLLSLLAQQTAAVAAPGGIAKRKGVVARFHPVQPRGSAPTEDKELWKDEVTADETEFHQYWRRKGGGGGGGRGGGGSSGGSSGGSTGGGGGGATGGGRGRPGSTVGGTTTTGSGPGRSFGGGSYYGGGARVPYKSGGRSPSGIVPIFLGSALLFAFWPGIWYHPVYYYPYNNPHTYFNASANQNQTRAVACGCDETVECGCDENGDDSFLREIIGNGTNLNSSLVAVANVNGTDTILLNGTLPDGTTAPGGTEDPFNGAGGLAMMARQVAWWPLVVTICALVFWA